MRGGEMPSRQSSPRLCARGATTRWSNPCAPSSVAPRFRAGLERPRIERFYGGETFLEDGQAGRAAADRLRRRAVGGVGIRGEFAQLFGRQLRDVANAVSGSGDVRKRLSRSICSSE